MATDEPKNTAEPAPGNEAGLKNGDKSDIEQKAVEPKKCTGYEDSDKPDICGDCGKALEEHAQPEKERVYQDRTVRAKKAFLDAFTETLGIVTVAAQQAGVHRSRYYVWRREDPAFAKDCDMILEQQMGFVEDKFLKAIHNDDLKAIIFYLDRKHPEYTKKIINKEESVTLEDLLDQAKAAEAQHIEVEPPVPPVEAQAPAAPAVAPEQPKPVEVKAEPPTHDQPDTNTGPAKDTQQA